MNSPFSRSSIFIPSLPPESEDNFWAASVYRPPDLRRHRFFVVRGPEASLALDVAMRDLPPRGRWPIPGRTGARVPALRLPASWPPALPHGVGPTHLRKLSGSISIFSEKYLLFGQPHPKIWSAWLMRIFDQGGGEGSRTLAYSAAYVLDFCNSDNYG